MAKKTHTWQYVENGCPTCNTTGMVARPCPRWTDPKHTAKNCGCSGGEFRSKCPRCSGIGKLWRR